MAATGKLITPATADRYGLGNSVANRKTLSNGALLTTFNLCGIH